MHRTGEGAYVEPKRRLVELTHEECYQAWRALKVYLGERKARPDTDYNDTAMQALEGAMGKIQFYLTRDYAGSKGLEMTKSPVATLPPTTD